MSVPWLPGRLFIAFINSVINHPSFPLIFQEVYCFILSGLSLKGLLVKEKLSGDASATPCRKKASIYSQHRHWAVLEEEVPIKPKHRVWAAWLPSVAGRQLSAFAAELPGRAASTAQFSCEHFPLGNGPRSSNRLQAGQPAATCQEIPKLFPARPSSPWETSHDGLSPVRLAPAAQPPLPFILSISIRSQCTFVKRRLGYQGCSAGQGKCSGGALPARPPRSSVSCLAGPMVSGHGCICSVHALVFGAVAASRLRQADLSAGSFHGREGCWLHCSPCSHCLCCSSSTWPVGHLMQVKAHFSPELDFSD